LCRRRARWRARIFIIPDHESKLGRVAALVTSRTEQIAAPDVGP
jgi:hypothetical protein